MTVSAQPTLIWWSAAEIADAGLPDLPGTKRRVNAIADREGWASDPKSARKRAGRGGGWEYHWSLFPARAQAALLRTRTASGDSKPVERASRDDAWAWFEGLNEAAKGKARVRLNAVSRVEALVLAGQPKILAVGDVARMDDVSERTIWSWLGMIEGVRTDDRLAYLAPRHRSDRRPSRRVSVDPAFGQMIKDDYLRQSEPSLTSVYDRCVRLATAQGIEVAPLHTLRRWIKRTISKPTLVFMRKGPQALRQFYPAQVRDKTSMRAMEAVNGDFHRFDVFVRFPGAPGQPDEIVRPQMVAFQDVYSGRLLAWRIDTSANSHAVQLCIGDMIEDWGIPEHVLLDNGREFAAKARAALALVDCKKGVSKHAAH